MDNKDHDMFMADLNCYTNITNMKSAMAKYKITVEDYESRIIDFKEIYNIVDILDQMKNVERELDKLHELLKYNQEYKKTKGIS